VTEPEAEGNVYEDDPREEPARYHRSPSGLLAALLVTVLAVVAFVVFREVFRDPPERANEVREYRSTVEAAQQAGIRVVNLREFPEGWVVNGVEYVAGERPTWAINLLTADDRFVGVLQSDVDDVAETLEGVGVENPEPGDVTTFASDLDAGPWQTWAGTDGELAYSTTLTGGDPATRGATLLVFGPAGRAEQEELISLLTTDDLA
jgi:sugar phosphate isomerase/epimerase